MTSSGVGNIVAWIALFIGLVGLAALALVGSMVLEVSGGDSSGSGMAILVIATWSAVVGVASLIAGVLGLFLLRRSSRRCWFAIIVGALCVATTFMFGVPFA